MVSKIELQYFLRINIISIRKHEICSSVATLLQSSNTSWGIRDWQSASTKSCCGRLESHVVGLQHAAVLVVHLGGAL